jgi:hypothetical protein
LSKSPEPEGHEVINFGDHDSSTVSFICRY